MRFSLWICCWLLLGSAAHAGDFDYEAFARLPVQDEGRLKPMNSFATAYLERFSGAAQLGRESAAEWLAGTMFNPSAAIARPLFLVKDTDAQAMLGLPPKPDNLYSFAEAAADIETNRPLIQSLLQRPEKELSAGQKAVLALYENTELFLQITLSSTLFLKLSVEVPADTAQHLHIDPEAATFMDYYRYLPELQQSLDALVVRKGSDPDKYTDAEKQLAETVGRLTMTMESSRGNNLLRVIPPSWGEAWLAPWEVFHAGQGSPQTAAAMRLWRDLASAYQSHDAARFRQASHALLKQSYAAPGVRPFALDLEMLYGRLDPLGKALLFYAAGFALALLGLARRPAYMCAIASVAAGALLQGFGLAARIVILERPPVGTLYESLIFVSLIAVLFGLYLEGRLRNRLGVLASAFIGSALLFVSRSFAEGDTMGMLVAVLNTNFWLATHVLCITSGYAFGIIAAVTAHLHLILRLLPPPPVGGRAGEGVACFKARRGSPSLTLPPTGGGERKVLRVAYGTALIALLFTALGTILGGIWADQSWGRFWGWDPKENGALLICLWLIWILHGRISGRLHELGFAVALGLLAVVIGLSWLGVNLLATGLHSYGFTDRAAISLGAFCAAEFIFAVVAYVTLRRRERAA